MPKKKAAELIKKYKTNDPFYIAEHKGISILYEALGGTFGYYNRYKRIKFIHINNDLNETMQKFVCAHELGHAVMHCDANTPFLKRKTFFSTDKIEVEANTFAVELLMPDNVLYSYKDSNLTIYDVCEQYSVPRDLAHIKNLNAK